MALNAEKYRSTRTQSIPDAATRMAFEDLAQRLEQLARDANGLGGGDGFKSGMVIFWLGDAGSIPAGWSEYTDLRGRFPRGMPSGGTVGDTGGSATHTHGTGGTGTGEGSTSTTGSNSGGFDMKDGTGASRTLAKFPHNHNIPEATTWQPYVDGIWIIKN